MLDIGHSRTAIVDWIRQPSPETGLYVADESQGWDYLPYTELVLLSQRIAGLLQQDRLHTGLGACVIMPTGALCVGALYATWLCGATATLISPPGMGGGAAYVAHASSILRDAQPQTIVTAPELLPIVSQAAEAAGLTRSPVILDSAAAAAASPVEPREPGECALIQFTSGSTAAPRGVMVSWENLKDNIRLITATIDWQPGDATASWLPLYHDMGLVGALLMTVANQGNLYLMRPDQFIREPVRWLQTMTRAQHSVSPAFGIGYAAHRLGPADIAGLDLSGWRSLVTGAEPVDLACLAAFYELAGPAGFSPSAFIPAYGLAEATLMVTAVPATESVAALRINSASLRMGAPVKISETSVFAGQELSGEGWMAGLGAPGTAALVVDEDGRPLPDGTLGQIVVNSSSVAMGYPTAQPAESEALGTRFSDGVLYTGDAGFCYDGQLYALGRMGSALKVRGKSVFMEDLEARVASVAGLAKDRICTVAVPGMPVPAIALFVERSDSDWLGAVQRVVRGDLGPAHMLQVITGPRGLIQRTSSGKPQRSRMWQLLGEGELDGATVIFDSLETGGATASAHHTPLPDGRRIPFSVQQLNKLLDETLAAVEIGREATIFLEGSLAEGFGNDASDIDFLAIVPGDAPTPTMPTVLFIDGRRTEIRTRSIDQLRYQLEEVARALAAPAAALLDSPGNDLINRCQRFLHAVELHRGDTWPESEELRSVLPYPEFGRLLARWWFARAQQSLRQAVAFASFGAHAEAKAWTRDGLQQAVKGWASSRGECYVETKWLPMQLDRVGAQATVAEYRELDTALAEGSVGGTAELLDAAVQLATRLGVTDVTNDPSLVRLTRVPGVTTWPIGGTLHVLRKDDVFALSDDAGREWRTVVFGRPVTEAAARRPHGYLAEFVGLGLVGLRWHDQGPIRPAIAMCDPARPYTCPPCLDLPAVSIAGAPRGEGVSLSPLPAQRFVECGMNLIWSNILVENAWEDLAGAVKSRQWGVADLAKIRLVGVLVRVVASTCGAAPMPTDVAALLTVERLLSKNFPDRTGLLSAFREAIQLTFSLGEIADEAPAKLAVLDSLVHEVRALSGYEFPASFHSREQWRLTLDAGYNWLRMGGYLNAALPLDEARDLLTAGGNQPHGHAGSR